MASGREIMGLDIGSDWVRAAVGSVSDDNQLTVEYVCECPSEGVRNGVIVNLEQAFRVVNSLISEAELQSGVEIKTAVVGLGGETISAIPSEGVAGITAKGFEITEADIRKSLELAKTVRLPSDRQILHTLVQDFCVDGRCGIKDPVDMTGHRLESRALIITGSVGTCSNVKKCVERAGIENCRLISSILADAESVLSQDEKEMGTILINIGASCTDMIAYVAGSPVYIGAVDMGSMNVTTDIAYLLNKPKQIAEQLKCESGCCYSPNMNTEEKILIPQVPGLPMIQMPKKELCKLIEPRMAELFTILNNQLVEREITGPFGGGVVLVGGGSLLSGVTNLANEIFRIQARIGFPEAISGLDRMYISPQYTTVLGLLRTASKRFYAPNNSLRRKNKVKNYSDSEGLLHKIANFFKTVV